MRHGGVVVYLMSNLNRRLYTGVTNNLARRLWEHLHGPAFGFTRRYNITRDDVAERGMNRNGQAHPGGHAIRRPPST